MNFLTLVTGSQADNLAPLESAEEWARWYTQLDRPIAVESARAGIFFKDKPKRRHSVLGEKSRNGIPVKTYPGPLGHLNGFKGEFEIITGDLTEDGDKIVHPLRTINGKWFGPAVERHGLDKTEKTKEMICMPVSDKNSIDRKTTPRTHHLLLGTLATVKEKGICLLY